MGVTTRPVPMFFLMIAPSPSSVMASSAASSERFVVSVHLGRLGCEFAARSSWSVRSSMSEPLVWYW